MTSKTIAQTNQQQKSEISQASGILQRAAVRSVSDAGVQSTDDKEALAYSNSAFSKDFSQVPISTTKPQQIMAKLMIGAVGDKYEQEADRVAAQVVQRINPPASVRLGEDEPVQPEEIETKDNEARLMRSPILQCRSSEDGMAATLEMEASINRARGGGRPMADNIRQPMEKAFGADFSGVKVHADAQSDQLNRSIQARAFTTGHNVFFRQGEYNPGSRGGQELLAHELTHVVQQNGGAVLRVQMQKHGFIDRAKVQLENRSICVIQRNTYDDLLKIKTRNRDEFIQKILGSSFGLNVWKFPKQTSENNGSMGFNCISAPYIINVHNTDTKLALHINFMINPGSFTKAKAIDDYPHLVFKLEKLHITARSNRNQFNIQENGASILTAVKSIHCGPNNDWEWGKNNVKELLIEMDAKEEDLKEAVSRYGQTYMKGIKEDLKDEIKRVANNREVTVEFELDHSWE